MPEPMEDVERSLLTIPLFDVEHEDSAPYKHRGHDVSWAVCPPKYDGRPDLPTLDNWFRELCEDLENNKISLKEFQRILRELFIPEDALMVYRHQFLDCHQTGTIREFVSSLQRFQNILSLDDGTVKDQLIRGSKPHVRKDLRVGNPKSLTDAIRIANAAEDEVGAPGSVWTSYASHTATHREAPPSDPMHVDAFGIGRLPDAEIARIFRENLCFRCRQPGHRARDCSKGRTKKPKAKPSTRINAASVTP
ncbi:hypothetical protein SJAG_04448 [Schizosaccharomyces japonicus yFS275]|uniref:CCHC-type domain-containing protein n=1 Tax=Schizosaccharomyces japonicus (strain yFS275 / FY16936) TaxID=402676 RepID=B6K6U8_SCHJY|nr:hypothetical protein SJAG_04448 [Schizosaccharomyces japonicus yFS275]EEB09252.2 hypothetical protein SJAG_04448 [Schizosaccharomyces japonicus yFS275]